jgi:prepilin-type processing-associated H-X9-DG protein
MLRTVPSRTWPFGVRTETLTLDTERSASRSAEGVGWPTFSSCHPGGVQFCFADGSIRLLKFGQTTIRKPKCSSDWYTFNALAGMKDGLIPTICSRWAKGVVVMPGHRILPAGTAK